MSELKKSTTKELAYAAIASALGALFLAVGFYLQLLEFLWYFLAAVMLLIPLSKGYIRAAVIAYIASSLLALFLCAFQFIFIMPYVIFMGIHPIMNEISRKYNFNVFLWRLIMVIWFNAAILILILFTKLFLFIDLNADGITVFIVLTVSTLAYFAYDYCIRLVSNRICRRIKHNSYLEL